MKGKKTFKDPYEYEEKVAEIIGGRTTIASGAAFGDYDAVSKDWMIDAKRTEAHSFRLDYRRFKEIADRCSLEQLPAYAINFHSHADSLVVIRQDDFEGILEALRAKKEGGHEDSL